jgi:uncharacterized membrane-anchored protein YitT (DUF2179 family)
MGTCMGGTEYIAKLIHKKKPSFNLFNIMFTLNVVVALASYFVYDYKIEPVLLCIIYSYASSTVRDVLNRKNQSAVRCEIITDDPDTMKDAIIHQLHHTATVIPATGAYSGQAKSVLLCIVNPTQVTELTKLVSQLPLSGRISAATSPSAYTSITIMNRCVEESSQGTSRRIREPRTPRSSS